MQYKDFRDELPKHSYLNLFIFDDKITKITLLARYEGISEIHSLTEMYDTYKFILDNNSTYYVKRNDVIDGEVTIKWFPFVELDKLMNEDENSNTDKTIKGTVQSIHKEYDNSIMCKVKYTDTIDVKLNPSILNEDDEMLLINSLCNDDEIELALLQNSNGSIPTVKCVNG